MFILAELPVSGDYKKIYNIFIMDESLLEQSLPKVIVHESGPVWCSVEFESGTIELSRETKNLIHNVSEDSSEFRAMLHRIMYAFRVFKHDFDLGGKMYPVGFGTYGRVFDLKIDESLPVQLVIKEDLHDTPIISRQSVLQSFIDQDEFFPEDIKVIKYYALINTKSDNREMPKRYVIMSKVQSFVDLGRLSYYDSASPDKDKSVSLFVNRLIELGIVKDKYSVKKWVEEKYDYVMKSFAGLRSRASGDNGAYPVGMNFNNVMVDFENGKLVFVLVDL